MTTAPVLDTDALSRLSEELGDADILRGFICRYVAMLDQRIERLEHALSAQDHEGWMDAVLSLKTSSALAGAQALSRLAAALQHSSERPHVEHRPSGSSACSAAITCPAGAMDSLRGLAAETAHQLRIFLQQLGVAGTRTT